MCLCLHPWFLAAHLQAERAGREDLLQHVAVPRAERGVRANAEVLTVPLKDLEKQRLERVSVTTS